METQNGVGRRALWTAKDQLDRLFGQQKKGFVLKASREQIKALSEHAFFSTEQRGHERRGPFSLRNQQPIYSNNHGKFFEASPYYCKQQQDINLSVSLAEIKRGALMVPHYNSRTTTVVLVVEGRGRFEMACPHLERQRHEPKWETEQRTEEEEKEEEEIESSGQYQKISSQLSPGDVFIIPAGHPVAVLASENENLRTLGFGINAKNNERNFLAGGDNILNQIEREAKELSFNMPPDFVEQVFGNQKESHFVAGPQQGHRTEEGRGGGHPLSSVLDFAAFFQT